MVGVNTMNALMGVGVGRSAPAIPDGQFTQTIYGWIKEGKLEDAVATLEVLVEETVDNRAGLSLLGYCHFQMANFEAACEVYEKLSRLHPENANYLFFFAQCLFKIGALPEAAKIAQQLQASHGTAASDDSSSMAARTVLLLAAIKYEEEQPSAGRAILEEAAPAHAAAGGAPSPSGSGGRDSAAVDFIACRACCLYKEEDFDGAKTLFEDAIARQGFRADLAYGVALCHYRKKQFGPALKCVADIVEHGVREHPELSVGSYTDHGVASDVRSVGNSAVLKDTALVEAFNLKAAIEYAMRNADAAKEALTDMPPRAEEELDPVTLHNQALMRMDEDATGGFRKFNFLLKNPPAPAETFGNLLLLYCKPQYAFYDLAADVMAENAHLVQRHLSAVLYEYLDATILRQHAPDKAYQKYDVLAQRHVEVLRRMTKQIQDARLQRDNEAIQRAITEYDNALEAYIPVLMAMASMHWDMENYEEVERIFRQSAEFCSEHEVWKLNVAHCFFMQDDKFTESIRYYEPLVKKHSDNLLGITAIVLANLCVAYIMTSQNEEAEELMRRIEQEEENANYQDPDKQNFHLCIVNLVIGTLYCAKGNFEFGVSRIIKSLEPYNKKLETDTWFYAKRCLLGLLESASKRVIIVNDATLYEIMQFLLEAEKHGAEVPTSLPSADASGKDEDIAERPTVASEARLIRKVLLRVLQL